MVKDIELKVQTIGEQMVKCNINCKGICNEPSNGILPRCLFFDIKRDNKSKGCVIIGINPGQSGKEESKYYLQNNNSYYSQVELWKSHVDKVNYYKFLTDFINTIGLKGPILWTELVKCQTKMGFPMPPLQTFRNCTYQYLSKELTVVPEDWPLIAIGREAHKALSYLYPTKSVLGVPHPTSSRGQFANLFVDAGRSEFVDEIQMQVDHFMKNMGNEHWLFQKKTK
ncbi:uracil-DNA glycosylase family protein [Saccharicrinis sp. FJH2]|uniref:uracil-DNA glycosylase family protein n=1 Tax=Saccharicrinis sp. FJH65 TaxID=3344659 RepID=UPI0035F446D9